MARRRAGPGETFWQFRHFDQNDARTGIDWRRSASSDHLFVREREWEAAHTVWLWADLSPSMRFRSSLAKVTKESRAVVLALALAELLARGGERVGLFGRPPFTGRAAARRVAEIMMGDTSDASLPPNAKLSRFSECLLFSDFLEPVAEMAERFEEIASQGVRGHLVQVLDPAEETLALCRPHRIRRERRPGPGDRRTRRDLARELSGTAQAPPHRSRRDDAAARLVASWCITPTGRPKRRYCRSTPALPGLERDYRYRAPRPVAGGDNASGSPAMMTIGAIGFLQPWVLAALAALPAIWWLLRLTPPTPQLVVFPPTRLLKDLKTTEETPAHSPWWLTVLRMLLAALIILALARPVLNPERQSFAGSGPLLLVIDNGWASAAHWAERREAIEAAIDRAARDGRTIVLAPTAPGQPVSDPLSPDQARERIGGLTPEPYATRPRRACRHARERARRQAPITACCGCPTGSIMATRQPSPPPLPSSPARPAASPCCARTKTTRRWPSAKASAKAASLPPASSPAPKARARAWSGR